MGTHRIHQFQFFFIIIRCFCSLVACRVHHLWRKKKKEKKTKMEKKKGKKVISPCLAPLFPAEYTACRKATKKKKDE